MIAQSDSESSSPSQPNHIMDFDIEPDEEWKKILKSRIRKDMESMALDAREQSKSELRNVSGPEARKNVEVDYQLRMETLKETASEQYHLELEKERNKRRWMAGEPMRPGWSQYLEQEQQHALDSFKRTPEPPVAPTHLQEAARSLSRAALRGHPNPSIYEPDDEWKKQVMSRIQLGFAPKIQHAKDKKLLGLRRGVPPEESARVKAEYDSALANVRALASDEYEFELNKERAKRRAAALASGALDPPAPPQEDDGDALLRPPSRVAGRRESSASQAAAREGDLEPDDIWKEKLRLRIQMDLKPMVRTANDTHFSKLRKVADSFAQLEIDHKMEMDRIQALTRSRYEAELARERLRRRGITEQGGEAGGAESSEEESDGQKNDDDADFKIFESDEEREKDNSYPDIFEDDELDNRVPDIRAREHEMYRRDIEAKKKAAEAKLVDPQEIDDIQKKIKEHVKWDDEHEEHDADEDLAPVPPEEGGEKPSSSASAAAAMSGVEKARRKQQEIDDQFRDYEINDLISDSLFDAPDPKWIEEQSFLWQQAQYEQQAEAIRRKRLEKRARHDSVGSSAGGSYGSPSSSPVANSHMPPPPVGPILIPQMPPVNRSHVPVTPWTPVSSLSLAAAAASKAAAMPPSPTITRKDSLLNLMSINPIGVKPRTLSVSSFDHPGPSPSPRNVPVIVPPARVNMVKTRSSSGYDATQ